MQKARFAVTTFALVGFGACLLLWLAESTQGQNFKRTLPQHPAREMAGERSDVKTLADATVIGCEWKVGFAEHGELKVMSYGWITYSNGEKNGQLVSVRNNFKQAYEDCGDWMDKKLQEWRKARKKK